MDRSKKLPGIAGIGDFFLGKWPEWGSFAVRKSVSTAVGIKNPQSQKTSGNRTNINKSPKEGPIRSFLGGIIYWQRLGQGIQLLVHCRLFVSCIVLVDQVLACGMVNCADSTFIGTCGSFFVTCSNSCIELFDRSLQCRLFCFVLSLTSLVLGISLDLGFNVGHTSIATSSYMIASRSTCGYLLYQRILGIARVFL